MKGILHPPDRVVSYLRYYPDKRGARVRCGIRYAKVYELSERHSLVKKRWPQYLYFDQIQGRVLQGVPKQNVHAMYTPQRRLSALLHSSSRDALEESAVAFVEALRRMGGLALARFGISGSLMVGLHCQDSDIDITAYGVETAKSVKRILLALLDGDERFHRYEPHNLKALRVRRGLQQAISNKDFVKQEQRKVLQGKFLAHDYYVRCVKDWSEITEQYGETRYRTIGECTISGQVIDDKESLLTPCKYRIERVRVLSGVESPKPLEVISFRGRFADQARLGEHVFARGRLERVQSAESEYARLVVGEGTNDVLRVVG